MSEKLKPCPFCGNAVTAVIGSHHFCDVMVCCDNCGIDGPLFDVDNNEPDDDQIDKNLKAATKHWNTRKAAK